MAKRKTPMVKKTRRYRSAKTGEFVPKEFAKKNPDTTVGETVVTEKEAPSTLVATVDNAPSTRKASSVSAAVSAPRDKSGSPPDQSRKSRFRLS